MNSQKIAGPLVVSRVVWGALNFSLVMYGLILLQIEKRFTLKIPESYSLLEMIALTLGLMVIFSLWFHAKKINPEKDMQKRFSLYVVCWALNEFMAIVAFSAVVLSESGNGFVYLTNFSLAFVGNLLTYPKEKV